MAPGIGEENDNLASWVAEVRGKDGFQADQAVLSSIRAFLQSKEAETAKTATHCVLENYPDWWVKKGRAPPGLELETEEEVDELYRHAGTLFDLGVPLTLAERRTPAFRFFQDIEAWGTKDAALSVDDLIGTETALTKMLGALIPEVFPHHKGFLDAAVFDATGVSQTRGVKKTSVRLVWPGVVVDSDRASRVRDLLVHRLTTTSAEPGPIADLQTRMQEFSPANAWHSVFGDAAYAGRSNVRMPLSDRVSPLPLRAPEKRPLAPVGVLRFVYGSEGKMKIEWLCRAAELGGEEWIKIGALRQGANTQLTEWAVPSFPGNQPIPPSSTRTGRVKVRTAGGSDGGGGLRLKSSARSGAPAVQERAGQLLTVERRFAGAADQFCEKMEQHLGSAVVEADGSYVWKQPGGDARIIMYAEDKRVKVVGRPNQVRSLVVIVAPYTEATPGLGPTSRQQLQQDPRLYDGRMPSAAFAPQDHDPREENADPREEAEAATGGGELRQATQNFEAQGQGELGIVKGDVVVITHDPEGDQHDGNEDRWVYGRSEGSGQCGWFPLSHTSALEETTTVGQRN